MNLTPEYGDPFQTIKLLPNYVGRGSTLQPNEHDILNKNEVGEIISLVETHLGYSLSIEDDDIIPKHVTRTDLYPSRVIGRNLKISIINGLSLNAEVKTKGFPYSALPLILLYVPTRVFEEGFVRTQYMLFSDPIVDFIRVPESIINDDLTSDYTRVYPQFESDNKSAEELEAGNNAVARAIRQDSMVRQIGTLFHLLIAKEMSPHGLENNIVFGNTSKMNNLALKINKSTIIIESHILFSFAALYLLHKELESEREANMVMEHVIAHYILFNYTDVATRYDQNNRVHIPTPLMTHDGAMAGLVNKILSVIKDDIIYLCGTNEYSDIGKMIYHYKYLTGITNQ